MAAQGAIAEDSARYAERNVSDREYIDFASKASGISPVTLALEYKKLAGGRGRLTLWEYVQYRVYDPALSAEEKARFITGLLHWPITNVVCDMTWQATTEDKWLCSRLLGGSDVRVPETLAVIDTGTRKYPGTRHLANANAFRDFAVAQCRDNGPFFAKENRGICSFGAFLVDAAERDRVHLKGRGWVDYDTVAQEYFSESAYLVQPVAANHPFFDAVTGSLATVRLCVLLKEDGPSFPFAVLKLPGKDAIADSFWRSGNVACDLDPQTGAIRTMRTKTPFTTIDHETHPETGAAVIGERLPGWDALLDLARRCSPIFAPVKYQSMDIAITPDGPLLIEINTGGGFDLPQLASSRGFLTDEVREFFISGGYVKLEAERAPRRSLFSRRKSQ